MFYDCTLTKGGSSVVANTVLLWVKTEITRARVGRVWNSMGQQDVCCFTIMRQRCERCCTWVMCECFYFSALLHEGLEILLVLKSLEQ